VIDQAAGYEQRQDPEQIGVQPSSSKNSSSLQLDSKFAPSSKSWFGSRWRPALAPAKRALEQCERMKMSLLIGDTAPDSVSDSTMGAGL
jgi:hypothetical protein